VAYETPFDPGPLPVYGRSGTAQARQDINNEFYENKRIFENHYNMDLALKALIIEAVDKVFLDEKYDRYTDFLTVSSRDLMDHLQIDMAKSCLQKLWRIRGKWKNL